MKSKCFPQLPVPRGDFTVICPKLMCIRNSIVRLGRIGLLLKCVKWNFTRQTILHNLYCTEKIDERRRDSLSSPPLYGTRMTSDIL